MQNQSKPIKTNENQSKPMQDQSNIITTNQTQ